MAATFWQTIWPDWDIPALRESLRQMTYRGLNAIMGLPAACGI